MNTFIFKKFLQRQAVLGVLVALGLALSAMPALAAVPGGHLIVDKVTVPSGSLVEFAVSATGTGVVIGNSSGTTTDAINKLFNVTVGTYSVSETVPLGWIQTSNTCTDVVVGASESKTCTIINTLIVEPVSPTISTTLSTTTVNTGTAVHDSATLSGATANASGTATYTVYTDSACSAGAQSAGVKTVTNSVVPDSDPITFNTEGVFNWQVVYSGDSNNNPATSTCGSEVLTVVQPLGHLVVDKITNPTGSLVEFAVSATGTSAIVSSSTSTVTDATSTTYTVVAGTYSVSETVPSGWDQTSNTCTDVVVGPGETKTCTITNTQQIAQYCSPGYWKQSHHFNNWVGYSPNQAFSSVFEGVTILWSAKGKPTPVSNPTLLQALEANGGGINALVRATVNALLNAAKLTSGYTTTQVVDMFNATYPGTDAQYDALRTQFTPTENCPLN